MISLPALKDSALEIDRRVALLTFNRDDVRNALTSTDLVSEIRAKEIAAKIAAKPPQAIRYAKRLLKLAQRQNLDEHLDVCSAFQAICHKTEDHQEALAAFFEKRPGRFKGR